MCQTINAWYNLLVSELVMAQQQKVNKKALSSSTAKSSSTNFLQTRPFAAINDSTQASPNLQKQSQKTSKIGHSFGQIPVQPKLKIGEPGDKYEQEADNVAAQVVQKINSPTTQRQELGEEEDLQMKPESGSIQREEIPEEEDLQMKPESGTIQRDELPEEDELQMKPESGTIQRDELPEEDELQMKPESGTIQRDELPEEDELQMKPESGTIQREELPEEEDLQMKPESGTIQRDELPEEDELQMKPETIQRQPDVDSGTASDEFETSLNNSRSGGQSLQPELRMKMESAMGADFSGVKVHTDTKSDQLNKSIQAKAFTTGKDVFFRQGEYNPGSQGGQELIAHELTHVVQQGGNGIQRQIQPKASQINQSRESPQVVQRDIVFNPKDFVNVGGNGNNYQKLRKQVFEYNKTISKKGNSQKKFTVLERLMKQCNQWLSEHKTKKKWSKTSKKDKQRGPFVEYTLKPAIQDEMFSLLNSGDFGESNAFNTERAKKELSAVGDGERLYFEVGILLEPQLNALVALHENGIDLTKFGFLPYSKAINLAVSMKGTDWGPKSSLTIKQKLQIATIQVENNQTDGIGYARYMGIKAKKNDDMEAQEYVNEQDEKAWEKTIDTVDENSLNNELGKEKAQDLIKQHESAKNILKRIFIVLQTKLQYRNNQDDPKLQDWEGPVARALSHGGRVNIFLPPVSNQKDQDAFWNWLTGGKSERETAKLKGRTAATHGFSWNDENENKNEKSKDKKDKKLKQPKEEKFGNWKAITNGKHWGMDLPVGGLGTKNVSGEMTLANGKNGHMYINYDPPTTTRGGALLIGVESSGSGKSNP